MILEGNITIPYKWTTGATIGRFLGEIKEYARIMGARCDGCGKVYAPPPDVCGECYRPLGDWVPLTGEGTVVAVSTVHRPMPWSPVEAPYTLALVRLDGADTNLLHLAGPDLRAGARVRAIFKTTREGTLLDIERFAALSDGQHAADNLTAGTEASSGSDPALPDRSDTAIEIERVMSGGSVSDVASVFQALPSRFRLGVAAEQLSFYFSIDEERWTVVITSETCIVEVGRTIENADCILKTSAEIFLGAINGTYNPSLTDLLTGRVKTNNPFLIQKFIEVFG